MTERLLDAMARVIRTDDKIERLAGTVRDQQVRIESLTERVVRLEAALELALDRQIAPARRRTTAKPAEPPSGER